MNKQILMLSLLLLIAPACGRKRKPFHHCRVHPEVMTPSPVHPEVITTTPISEPSDVIEDTASTEQRLVQDEDVDAFVLAEDENPFIPTTPLSNTDNVEEELTVVNDEPTTSGAQRDSANYGLTNVYYDYDQHKIRADQEPTLKHNVDIVKGLTDKGYHISINGHACNFAGSTDYNMMLSEKRANSVARYFEKHGIDKQLLHPLGHGSTHPLVPSGNLEQQAPNRRVEIYAYPASSYKQ